MRVAVLDWHQSADDRARAYISASDAARLVERLAAEEIRPGKVIRRFAPDSVFSALWPAPPQVHFIPAKLPPVEVGNCKFIPPYYTESQPNISTVRAGWDWSQE